MTLEEKLEIAEEIYSEYEDRLVDLEKKLAKYRIENEQLKAEIESLKTDWHDLREEPKDLPDTSREVLIVRDFGENKPYKVEFDNYYNDFVGWGLNYREHAYFTKVIAWCEVPQFKRS